MNSIPPPIKEIIREYVFSTQPKVEFLNLHQYCKYRHNVGHGLDCPSCAFDYDIHLGEGLMNMIIRVRDLKAWKRNICIDSLEENRDGKCSTSFTSHVDAIYDFNTHNYYVCSGDVQTFISKELYDMLLSEYKRFDIRICSEA